MAAQPFWKSKTLLEMSPDEWEALCDGCGKCCLAKLEYEDDDGQPTGIVEFTDIACKLLDGHSCQCKDYDNRFAEVPDCVKVSAKNIDDLYFMPPSCAYRLVSERQDLPWWHPLISGDPETVVTAGFSARGRVVSEEEVTDAEDWPSHIVDWPGRLVPG
ncbi:YcgN family cysteine cluster protein [Lacibacterium aquatile]|uniref:UPF0260 protein ACFSM5_17655 n=1 Tax=Lacibacterium aquatile TaxID=1168082 RepID=A0ABW5DW76_9PROT